MQEIKIDLKVLENEPRKGLKKGHIPNSKNIFWGQMITKNGTLIKKNKIKEKFSKINQL